MALTPKFDNVNTSRPVLPTYVPPDANGSRPRNPAQRFELDGVRAGAFVLIAVLLLVALVTVLVVGTSMLARVERGAVSSEANTEAARQNALFGLNVALAQLQKTAGPDQRVTARADILDSNPNTAQVDGITQPYWTGVWQTGALPLDTDVAGTGGGSLQRPKSFGVPSANPAPTPTIAQKVASATWLVSTPINSSVNPPQPYKLDPTADPATYLPNIKLVALAKNLPDPAQASPTTAPLISVKAPLINIYPSATVAAGPAPTPSGKYAYWVADEGIKAKPNIVDPTYGIAPSGTAAGGNSNFVENQLHFLTPQAIAAQNGLFGPSNMTDLRNTNFALDLPKVSSLQSLGYVGGSPPAVAGMSGTGAALFSPDATTYSYGVLADVRNGGLKTDLSQAFEDPSQFSAFLSGLTAAQSTQLSGDQKIWLINTRSFDSGNNMTAVDFGPRWQGLYNYYSLYKNTVPNTVQPSGTATGCPWSNVNKYSSGNPGTATPQMDMRVFNYTSNAPGSGGAVSSTQELGESYAPRIMGFAVYFSLTSTQGAVGAAGTHTYGLVQYMQPRLVLYNPYNVTVTAGSITPYVQQISANIFSRNWSISVGSQAVQTSKPISWNGSYTPPATPTATPNPQSGSDLTLGTAAVTNNTFKPGELRVVGLAATTAVSSPGNQLNFPKLTDGVGQAQYMNMLSDTGTAWSGVCNDNDHVVISYPSQGTFSNNGFYVYNGSPTYWPNTTSTSGNRSSNLAGRLFFATPNDAAKTVDLGPISALAAAPGTTASAKTFAYFVFRPKGLKQSSTASGTLAPLPTFSSCDGILGPLPSYYDAPMADTDINFTVSNLTTSDEMNITVGGGSPPSPPFDTFWGGSDVGLDPNDPSLLPLRDVPRQPLLSLGQFMHMATRNSTAPNSNSGNPVNIDTDTAMMSVGGSYADPFFALNRVNNDTTGSASAVAYFDDNFLMNQGLFDTYYFSSVPLPAASMDAAYKQVLPAMVNGTTAFTDANIASRRCVLPDSRMSFYAKNGVPPQTTTASAPNYVSDYRKSSANLLLNGAFNVNSTSVNAWVALLSSLSGNSVNYLNPSTGTFASIDAGSLMNPIFRFPSPVSVSYPVSTASAPSFWGGINALSNAQVTALAQAIVAQVKLRGPFLSMADFLNRRLDATNTALGLKGALQAAIDNTTINSALQAQYPTPIGTGTKSGRGNNPPAVIASQLPSPGTTAVGVPGWLMQQDLVQCFSPVMTVRSDTFVVRCYGEADNVHNGATAGRAWGEAVVQRLPDFVDQTDPVLAASPNLGDATPLTSVSATNQIFGRRFKVVSFRWLNESDL